MHVRIPVGFQTAATVKDRGTFSCPRCKHWQRAEVVGSGSGFQTYLGADGAAQMRARAHAARDVRRTLRFATCPKCKQRSGHVAYIAPYVLGTLGLIAFAYVFALLMPVFMHDIDAKEAVWLRLYGTLVVAALLLIVMPLTLASKWRHNDARVRWLDF